MTWIVWGANRYPPPVCAKVQRYITTKKRCPLVLWDGSAGNKRKGEEAKIWRACAICGHMCLKNHDVESMFWPNPPPVHNFSIYHYTIQEGRDVICSGSARIWILLWSLSNQPRRETARYNRALGIASRSTDAIHFSNSQLNNIEDISSSR